MAEVESAKVPSLAEQYSLEKEQKPEMGTKSVDVTKDENPVSAATEEVVNEKTEETPAIAEESSGTTPAAEESSGTTPAAAEESSGTTTAAAEESSETAEKEDSGDQEAVEQTPEIKIETAPADFRFPTTNQTRHCFTRYVEYHRCIAAKGEDAPECDKFARYYRSLCPGDWIDRWNEQRENGTFPGPL